MKQIKRIYISILVIFLFLSANIFVFAEENIYTNDDNSATWKIKEQEINYNSGVKHTLMYGTTTDIAYQSEGNQMVNAFEMKTDGITSKLVTWAIQSGKGGYGRSGLSNIAKDYEEEHPGWIVIAGINGDQYYPKYGSGLGVDGSFYFPNQPYYPMIIDGERRFPITPTGNSANNYVGIANNDSINSFINASSLSTLKIEVLDENDNIIYIHNVDKINETPLNQETSVWFSHPSADDSSDYVTYDVKSNKNIYVVESAELAYMNNSRIFPHSGASDSLFGRGVISQITKEVTIDRWQFAVDTNNEELSKYLSVDTKIRVQYYYENEQMNQVETSLGYHSTQRKDNKDVTTTAAYDTNRYNRSIFGKKADGTYVLMTIAKGTYSGTSQNESNTILKQLGVTEAYQQDGGGSVTAIIRNEYGSFDVVNKSSDSGTNERAILNGCFFVIRDPGFASYQKDSTRTSIAINRINDYNKEYISNVIAEINGKTYPLNNDTLTIDGLEDDTAYLVNLTYDLTINGITKSCSSTISAHTDSYKVPSSGVKTQNINSTSVEFIRNKVSEDEYIYVKVIIDNKEYDLTNENEPVLVSNLKKNSSYLYQIKYAVKDSFTGKVFEKVDEYYLLTKKYTLPTIEEFTAKRLKKDSVEIKVNISDPDNLVYSSYILYNNKQYVLENLSESFVIEDLNIEEEDYSFQLFISYQEGNNYQTLSSDIYTITHNDAFEKEKGCNGCGIIYIQLITITSLFIIVLRKNRIN